MEEKQRKGKEGEKEKEKRVYTQRDVCRWRGVVREGKKVREEGGRDCIITMYGEEGGGNEIEKGKERRKRGEHTER